MKKQVRQGVFETNSSSVHSLTIFSAEEFDKWNNGELLWDWYKEVFVDASKKSDEKCYLLTYDEVVEASEEFDISKYTTKSGDKVIAMAYERYG